MIAAYGAPPPPKGDGEFDRIEWSRTCEDCGSSNVPLRGQTHCWDCINKQLNSIHGQFADNTPLFEAMDRMVAEVPADERAKIPPISNGETVSFTWDPDSGRVLGEPQVTIAPAPSSSESWVLASSNTPQLTWQPFQPWRRGPLASWTLVNISCLDGRLTVVMKRGRGEVVIETGVDDEGVWERLGKKVVDIDKEKTNA